MALSFDDRIIGEKTDYYCSSSEESGNESGNESDTEVYSKSAAFPKFVPENEISGHSAKATGPGRATNTGPKGVINDWRRFKQLESEKREEQKIERIQLANRLTLTCRSHLNDEAARDEDAKIMEELESEWDTISEQALQEYRKTRLEEMARIIASLPKFGAVRELCDGTEFIKAADEEKAEVTIVIHVYDHNSAACETMNGCLVCLAKEYPTVKFCKILVTSLPLSINFRDVGVPALLVYKAKQMIGNFVSISRMLREDFFADDIAHLLYEHGCLPPKERISFPITKQQKVEEGDDSDYDVD